MPTRGCGSRPRRFATTPPPRSDGRPTPGVPSNVGPSTCSSCDASGSWSRSRNPLGPPGARALLRSLSATPLDPDAEHRILVGVRRWTPGSALRRPPSLLSIQWSSAMICRLDLSSHQAADELPRYAASSSAGVMRVPEQLPCFLLSIVPRCPLPAPRRGGCSRGQCDRPRMVEAPAPPRRALRLS